MYCGYKFPQTQFLGVVRAVRCVPGVRARDIVCVSACVLTRARALRLSFGLVVRHAPLAEQRDAIDACKYSKEADASRAGQHPAAVATAFCKGFTAPKR